MQNKFEKILDFLRTPLCRGLVVFCLAFAALTAAAVTVQDDVLYGKRVNSGMASFPISEDKGDTAVCWNHRANANTPVRLDNRDNLRPTPFKSSINQDAVSLMLRNLDSDYKYVCSKEANSNYYRRLWQKILPTRAGPLA